MKIRLYPALAVLLALAAGPAALAATHPISTDGSDPKTWDPKMDGPIAAPASHQVIFENDNIRIMSVVVKPGQSEPYHNHTRCSVLVFDQPAKVVDKNKDGQVLPEAVVLGALPWAGDAAPKGVPLVWLQPPEATHSITNTDSHDMHLTRIELKKGCEAPPR